MIQQSMPVLFGSERGRVPAKIIHAHGTVGNPLVSPKAHLAFVGLWRKCRLARLPRLLFHDHERLVFQAAAEIMTERDRRGNSLPRHRTGFVLLLNEHFEKSGIIIERNKIKIGVEHSLVNCVER